MSETDDADDEKVTEAEAVVRTSSGERYLEAELSKSGDAEEDDDS